MALNKKIMRNGRPTYVFTGVGSIILLVLLILVAAAHSGNDHFAIGTSPSCDGSDGNDQQMRQLAFLSGDWLVELNRYNSETGQLELVASELTLICTPIGGKKLMMLSITGDLRGRYYEAGGIIYYDPVSNQYRKIWSDNIASSPVTLVGELLDGRAGIVTHGNDTISLRMHNSDRSLTECVRRFSQDSAAFMIFDGVTNTELTRFTLHRSSNSGQ